MQTRIRQKRQRAILDDDDYIPEGFLPLKKACTDKDSDLNVQERICMNVSQEVSEFADNSSPFAISQVSEDDDNESQAIESSAIFEEDDFIDEFAPSCPISQKLMYAAEIDSEIATLHNKLKVLRAKAFQADYEIRQLTNNTSGSESPYVSCNSLNNNSGRCSFQ